MSSLGVVTNGVPGLDSNPLRDRAVLLLLFAQDFFDFERFLRRLFFFERKRKERLAEAKGRPPSIEQPGSLSPNAKGKPGCSRRCLQI